jgi:putative transposase
VGGLKEFSVKCRVDIHAWVLMTNQVHLLCTPHEAGGVSRMMQALGRQYVRYLITAIKEREHCGKGALGLA